jgi:hypothetical protein
LHIPDVAIRSPAGERLHVVLGQVGGDGRHLVVLPQAALVVPELDIKVSLVLTPDDGGVRFLGLSVLAMT